MAKKIDGVVEAVHYSEDGKIQSVRIYERRGPVFSDRVLLSREAFAQRLKSGKVFLTGERRLNLGGTFITGRPVVLRRIDGQEWVTTAGRQIGKDHLDGVPVF